MKIDGDSWGLAPKSYRFPVEYAAYFLCTGWTCPELTGGARKPNWHGTEPDAIGLLPSLMLNLSPVAMNMSGATQVDFNH